MNNGRWGLGVLCFLLLHTYPSLAQTTHRIPTDFPTLQAAVNQANNGDTLFLESGVYTDSTNITGKTLVLIGDSTNRPEIRATQYGIGLRLLYANVECQNILFTELPFSTPPPHTAIECQNSTLSVHHCAFRNVDGPVRAMQSTIIASHSEFRDISGWAAITLNLGSYTIHNNVLYNLAWQGISCSRSNGAIFNNTIVGNTDTAHFALLLNPDDTSYVFNNLITNFGTGILLSAADTFQLYSALRVHHNDIHQTTVPYWFEYNERLNMPVFKGAFVPKPGTGEQHTTPLFLDAPQNNYTLAAGSPCIDAGFTTFPVDVQRDMAGNPRLVGAAPDIGAFEYQAVSSVVPLELENTTAVRLYPLPAREQLFVHFPTMATGTASLLDVTGRVFQQYSFTEQQELVLDMHTAAGFSILVLITEHGTSRHIVVKE